MSFSRLIKDFRKRPKMTFNDPTNDHSRRLRGKKSCRQCYGRGYQEWLTVDGQNLIRKDCWCALNKQEKENAMKSFAQRCI